MEIEVLIGILPSLEPYEIDESGAVREMCDIALLAAPGIIYIPRLYKSAYLYIGHLSLHLAYPVDAAAVDIFIRIILQEAGIGLYAKLFGEDGLLLRPHAGEICYVLGEEIHGCRGGYL